MLSNVPHFSLTRTRAVTELLNVPSTSSQPLRRVSGPKISGWGLVKCVTAYSKKVWPLSASKNTLSRSRNNNNNKNNHDKYNVYGAIIMTSLRKFTRFTWWMQTGRRPPGYRQPPDQANWLGLWVRRKLAAIIHDPSSPWLLLPSQ